MRTCMRIVVLAGCLLLALVALAAPKHVILMIGDGMGPDIVTATGDYKFGAAYHRAGGDKRLTLETLENHRFALTFSSDGKGYDFTWAGGDKNYVMAGATDSAAAATALATGVKTYNKAIGMDVRKQPLTTVLQLAQAGGWKTGIVTTVTFYHATPAGFAAHNPTRDDYLGIGHEILFSTKPDVVMGAGNPDAGKEPSYQYFTKDDWEAVKGGKTPYKLVQTREEFQQLAETPANAPVLGLFKQKSSLVYRGADGAKADPTLPTLAEMTRGALRTLEDRPFFLMVEGGSIDTNAHANNLNGAIGEALAFDEAVAAVLEWIAAHGGWEENLLVITADHDTGYLNSVAVTEAGKLPTAKWGTTGTWGGHTNRPVDVYYQGSGSANLAKCTLTVNDFERGTIPAIDNTDIARLLISACTEKPAAK